MQRNRITTDKVLADLEHDKVMARKHNQYSVAKGCTELQGKYLAMFTDRLQTDEQHRPLTAEQKQAAAQWVAFSASPEYPDMTAWALSPARRAVNAEQGDSGQGH